MKVAVLGSINIDLIAGVERFPSPGQTLTGHGFRREPGGKGANQAVAAARLGADVSMFGAVGRDADGDVAIAALRQAGVDVQSIRRSVSPTGVALIITDGSGENQIVVCPGANAEAVPPAEADFDVLIAQLEIPVETVEAAFLATEAFTVLNASPARSLPESLVRRADLIVVNEHEYAAIDGLHKARLVVVTYGSLGSALFENGERRFTVPAQQTSVVNSVGAGDAYCAAVVLGLAAGNDPRSALMTASAVGAAAVADPASQPALLTFDRYEVTA
ncbi:ribokinase [Leifsonia sp. P73]|uniref:ribokinase n=1 Tax=Leifsonia sp. P73 TaxID=3423959 RepID=UPI003DA25DF0